MISEQKYPQDNKEVTNYQPHFESLETIIEHHSELTPEQEILELTHLRHGKKIPTVQLFATLNQMQIDEDVRNVLAGELAIACNAEHPELISNNISLLHSPFDEETIKYLLKIAVNYYEKNQN